MFILQFAMFDWFAKNITHRIFISPGLAPGGANDLANPNAIESAIDHVQRDFSVNDET
ncbi:hypothetical protein LF1_08570 [Rubripirellula obstinata]|uniref:Uncharacterized protein n=1 Tax=Rubripirellula obstinata TaxID=406547 RepID=A0A5B1CFK0_9BACT|nr:hypothetical protein [Rubripirellula obstinata]KAA1258340.1 hypothetical protein LF1_08570 [Rubripirellula obstinata]